MPHPTTIGVKYEYAQCTGLYACTVFVWYDMNICYGWDEQWCLKCNVKLEKRITFDVGFGVDVDSAIYANGTFVRIQGPAHCGLSLMGRWTLGSNRNFVAAHLISLCLYQIWYLRVHCASSWSINNSIRIIEHFYELNLCLSPAMWQRQLSSIQLQLHELLSETNVTHEWKRMNGYQSEVIFQH